MDHPSPREEIVRHPLRCAAIIFDLDGVLVDSTACIERYWRQWAEERGLSPDEILRVAHGRRTVDVIALVAPHLDVPREATLLADHEAADSGGVGPVPGATALLQLLPPDTWAVVTSGTRRVAMHRLLHVGLPLPRVLVTAEDVRRGKPHPDGYLSAAEQLGVLPAEAVVVEDAPAGIEAAHAAGMAVIAVATTHPREQLARADAVAPTLAALGCAIDAAASRRHRLHLWVNERH